MSGFRDEERGWFLRAALGNIPDRIALYLAHLGSYTSLYLSKLKQIYRNWNQVEPFRTLPSVKTPRPLLLFLEKLKCLRPPHKRLCAKQSMICTIESQNLCAWCTFLSSFTDTITITRGKKANAMMTRL